MTMRAIVTDRRRDYISASNFNVLVNHLDSLINETCRKVTQPPTTIGPRPRKLQSLHRIFTVINGVRNDSAENFSVTSRREHQQASATCRRLFSDSTVCRLA